MAAGHLAAITNVLVCLGISAFVTWRSLFFRPDPIERWVPPGLVLLYLLLSSLLWRLYQPHREAFVYPTIYLRLVPAILGLLAIYQLCRSLGRYRFKKSRAAIYRAQKEQAQKEEARRRGSEAHRLQLLLEHTHGCLAKMRQAKMDACQPANTDTVAPNKQGKIES